MGESKPTGWDTALNNAINEGLNFKATNERLTEAMGEEGKVSQATYSKHKQQLRGAFDTDSKLEDISEKIKGQKPRAPPKPQWTKQKQLAADNSKLAELVNKGIYAGVMPFCKSKALKEQDVADINLGGAVVGIVQWAVPDINLDHPIIILVTRGVMFYLKFKQICSNIQAKIEEVKNTIGASKTGIKPEFNQK